MEKVLLLIWANILACKERAMELQRNVGLVETWFRLHHRIICQRTLAGMMREWYRYTMLMPSGGQNKGLIYSLECIDSKRIKGFNNRHKLVTIEALLGKSH